MSTISQSWESLERELRPRLEVVGFRPAEFLHNGAPALVGVSFAAFESAYAVLYCVRIVPMDMPIITAATDFTCDAMRRTLTKAGANDWSRDGYVLAAMPAAPESAEISAGLRVFEQGRAICRRHVIWPESPGGSWAARLDRVTLLALPEAEAPAAPTNPQPPGLGFIEDIHTRLKSGASYKLVADELVRAAREREDFHAP
ncbi:MAG TPA: hypothetical protein PKX00_03445 [Opitutaceae bacterium]|nr:hypothetical protein [Opitutaceae bacterium]